MYIEGPSPSKAMVEGDPGPTAEGHAAAERLSAAGSTALQVRQNLGV